MKKIIIVLAALLTGIGAQAQIGVVAGVANYQSNISDAYKSYLDCNDYCAGITLRLGGDIFGFQVSLLASQQSEKLGDLVKGKDFDFHPEKMIGHIPVQLQLGLPVFRHSRLYGFAEPEVSFDIDKHLDALTSAHGFSDGAKIVFKNLDCSFGLGVGFDLFGHLQFQVRYCWNLGEFPYDGNFSGIKSQVKDNPCNYIKATFAILL